DRPVPQYGPAVHLPVGDGLLLHDPTVVGGVLAQIGGIEHIKNARLAPSGEEIGARDQQRSSAADIEVLGIEVTPIAGGEPVDQRQALGGIEFQNALAEVVHTIIAAA